MDMNQARRDSVDDNKANQDGKRDSGDFDADEFLRKHDEEQAAKRIGAGEEGKPNFYHQNANLDGGKASHSKSRESTVLDSNRGDNGNRKLSHELDLGDDHFQLQADK